MNNFLLVYPMFVMVLLTFVVLISLFRARSKSVADGVIQASYFNTYQGQAEPDSSIKLMRHFTNLFEAPVLFYVCCVSAMVVDVTKVPFLVLAWVYVLVRLAHAYIHTGDNRLMSRIRIYFVSWIVLLAMWVLLVLRMAMLS